VKSDTGFYLLHGGLRDICFGQRIYAIFGTGLKHFIQRWDKPRLFRGIRYRLRYYRHFLHARFPYCESLVSQNAPAPDSETCAWGLLTGLIAMALPQVLGVGYGWTQLAMTPVRFNLSLALLVVLVFAKIAATAFTVESGGSGGVFAPGIVIGGLVGACFGVPCIQFLICLR